MAKRIIFVCIENACRSQMAAAFARQLARELGLELEVASGGTKPVERVDDRAIQVMREKGIDISGERPRAIDPRELRDFDYIITMGCGAEGVCPAGFTGRTRDWGIPDPKGKSLEFYHAVRDEIEQKVRELIEEVI
ncbi:MAG: arsenate reductase ArsC [Candidatus Acetothermia bacterium]|nr:arsenate reductase ArsC [Candidatus Acetothermia bacterium]MDH7505494.1 arsenate reductase ArsC [Candidatus Acetothermia bacterium]